MNSLFKKEEGMTLPARVVIVEDEMMEQRYLKDILENLGIPHVKAFTNAMEALSWLSLVKCDMLILDINLEGSMDGIQLAKCIEETHTIPIIFTTGYSDKATVDEALSITPFAYMVKPFSKNDMELQIRVCYQKFLHYKIQLGSKENSSSANSKIIKINDELEFSLISNILTKQGKYVYLPDKQNELVSILCRSINHVVSYEQLEYILWRGKPHAKSSLRTLVYSLRMIVPELKLISHPKLGYSIKYFQQT